VSLRPQAAAIAAIAIAGLACILPSCDGGPIGTGISGLGGASGIAGDVAAVPGAALGESSAGDDASVASLPAGSIEVAVEGRDGTSTTVAEDGSFAITGNFAGPVTLRFDAPDRVVRASVDVPSGALVVLPGVVLARSGALSDGGRALNLLARVVSVDCERGHLLVETTGSDVRERREIALGPDTRITDVDAGPVDCAAISKGAKILVDGRFDPLSAADPIEALGVMIGGRRAAIDQAVAGVGFAGWVAGADCKRGLLLVADAKRRGRVRIDDATAIRDEGGSSLDCRRLQIGDKVLGEGRLRLGEPEVVEAETVRVARVREGSVEIRLAGRIAGVDCGRGKIEIVSKGVRSVIDLGDATETPEGVSCDDVQVDDWLRGTGRVDLARADRRIEALRLSAWRPGLDSEPAGGPSD
jgi:hypothetical protein